MEEVSSSITFSAVTGPSLCRLLAVVLSYLDIVLMFFMWT